MVESRISTHPEIVYMGKKRSCIEFIIWNSKDGISEQYIFIPDKKVNNDIKSVRESNQS